jgi:hypothetical protein
MSKRPYTLDNYKYEVGDKVEVHMKPWITGEVCMTREIDYAPERQWVHVKLTKPIDKQDTMRYVDAELRPLGHEW